MSKFAFGIDQKIDLLGLIRAQKWSKNRSWEDPWEAPGEAPGGAPGEAAGEALGEAIEEAFGEAQIADTRAGGQ